MVLVDSSIWISFLRGNSELPESLPQQLTDGEARICPVIWVELYSGVKGKREEQLLGQIADLCPSLEIDHAVWKQACLIAREARLSGINCPLADILIVACARQHGATLSHDDKHMALLTELLS